MAGRPTLDLRPLQLDEQDAGVAAAPAPAAPPPAPALAPETALELAEPPREEATEPLDATAPPATPGGAGRVLFGEWLVRRRVLSRQQLLQALTTSHRHEWRIGDAVVVLRFAPRARVEAEADLFKLFERHPGLNETRRLLLEQRVRLMELEREPRRLSRRACGGTLPGWRRSSV